MAWSSMKSPKVRTFKLISVTFKPSSFSESSNFGILILYALIGGILLFLGFDALDAREALTSGT